MQSSHRPSPSVAVTLGNMVFRLSPVISVTSLPTARSHSVAVSLLLHRGFQIVIRHLQSSVFQQFVHVQWWLLLASWFSDCHQSSPVTSLPIARSVAVSLLLRHGFQIAGTASSVGAHDFILLTHAKKC